MCAVITARTPAPIAARNGSSAVVFERLDRGEREVRVDGRVAVPGEVLRARGDTRGLESANERSDMPCDERAVGAERADADHRVLGVRVDVGDGREVEGHADVRKLRAERPSDARRELDVVDDAERGVARVRASRPGLEPGDIAALLVDRDDDVRPLGAKIARERSQLFAVLDVPRVQHDAAEAVREPTPNPVGSSRPLEAREDAARGEPLELAHHALTAPAVRPNAILRCTRRKKMTTGIAVRVEAAISPPQSVARLVP